MPDATLAADAQTLLSLDGVEVRRGAFRLVLSSLSLRVGRGELVLVGGPAGAGKSTLLRMIAGLLEPSAGRILVAGEDLSRLGPRARAHLRRLIGIVPQETDLFDGADALDNVTVPSLIAGAGRADAVERARVALHRVGLDVSRLHGLPVGVLSAGERRLVVLARALANRPALLLVDEPPVLDAGAAGSGSGASGGGVADLDLVVAPGGSDRLFELLGQFCRTGVAVIVAMRDIPATAATARRYQLVEGRLQDGP